MVAKFFFTSIKHVAKDLIIKGEIKMISKVSFAGRETLLTKPLKEAQKNDFLSYAKVYSKDEIAKMKEAMSEVKMPKPAKEVEYASPFAPIKKEAAAADIFVSDSTPTGIDLIV